MQPAETRSVAQLNVKVNGATLDAFARECKRRGRSQREVIEGAMECFTAASANNAVLHLDGTLCPISQMVKSLADAAARHMLDSTAPNARAAMSEQITKSLNPDQLETPESKYKQVKTTYTPGAEG